jgi:hypothetical protein
MRERFPVWPARQLLQRAQPRERPFTTRVALQLEYPLAAQDDLD